MSDHNLIAVDLVVNPAEEQSATLTHSYDLVGLDLATSAPEYFGLIFTYKGLSPVSHVTGSPVLDSPSLVPSARVLYPASIAVRSLKQRRCLATPRLVLNLSAPRSVSGDRHVRRGGNSYASAYSDLLPTGLAWPRHSGTILMQVVNGLTQVWGKWVDRRAADLLEQETDPRKTLELLLDWERNWGLPDPCFQDVFTVEQRREQLIMKMTLMGGQSREFFYFVASAFIGDHILITEYAPFMCGISQCGDTRDDQGDYRWQIGPPEMRFYWTVHVGDPKLTWFRASVGQAGIDPHLRIGLRIDLECLLRRWKPAHTDIVFDYSGLVDRGPMAGTP